MIKSDEQFCEAYKPLQVPAHFNSADTPENKIIFALGQLGEGTAASVIGKLEKLEPGILNAEFISFTKNLLNELYKNGHLTGHETAGLTYYNLHKITQANDGAVKPDLLAPGLD